MFPLSFSSGHNRGKLRGERSEDTYVYIKGTRVPGIHIPPQIARDHSPSPLLFIQPQTPAAHIILCEAHIGAKDKSSELAS